jgi:hypothetical protein
VVSAGYGPTADGAEVTLDQLRDQLAKWYEVLSSMSSGTAYQRDMELQRVVEEIRLAHLSLIDPERR